MYFIAKEKLVKFKDGDCRNQETDVVNFKLLTVDKRKMIKPLLLITVNNINAFENEI